MKKPLDIISRGLYYLNGVPDVIRTHGLSLRRGMHYPAMLREHLCYFIIIHYICKFSIIIFFTLMYN